MSKREKPHTLLLFTYVSKEAPIDVVVLLVLCVPRIDFLSRRAPSLYNILYSVSDVHLRDTKWTFGVLHNFSGRYGGSLAVEGAC